MTQFSYGAVADLSEGEVIGIMVGIDTYEPLIIMLPGHESREHDISMWTETAKDLGCPERYLEQYYKAYIGAGYRIYFNTGEAASAEKLAEKLVADALKKKASKQKRKSKRGRMVKKEIMMTTSKDEKRFPKGDPREGMTADEWRKTLPIYREGMSIAISFPKGSKPWGKTIEEHAQDRKNRGKE